MIGHGDADEILGALPTRRGHFLLESGYHTDQWISLDGLFRDPTALALRIVALAGLIWFYGISAVCGPLLGGAFLVQALAIGLGVRFYCGLFALQGGRAARDPRGIRRGRS